MDLSKLSLSDRRKAAGVAIISAKDVKLTSSRASVRALFDAAGAVIESGQEIPKTADIVPIDRCTFERLIRAYEAMKKRADPATRD